MNANAQKIIGVKELRNNLEEYINQINRGMSFIVVKRSKPVFQIKPVIDEYEEDGKWEKVVDFTEFNKDGIEISDLISRL
jgi:prevent-host-death family protein